MRGDVVGLSFEGADGVQDVVCGRPVGEHAPVVLDTLVVQLDGLPEHDQPFSTWQLAEQPSPADALPSSQPSAPAMTLSPQTVVQDDGWPEHDQPRST